MYVYMYIYIHVYIYMVVAKITIKKKKKHGSYHPTEELDFQKAGSCPAKLQNLETWPGPSCRALPATYRAAPKPRLPVVPQRAQLEYHCGIKVKSNHSSKEYTLMDC